MGRARRVTCVCGCGRAGIDRGRGLIDTCRRREVQAGTLERWPCRRPPGGSRARSTLVEDALILRARHGLPEHIRSGDENGNRRPSRYGITWERVAAELGVSFRTLEKARERAGWPDVGRPAGAVRIVHVPKSPRSGRRVIAR